MIAALAVALACGLPSVTSALAGGKKPPPEPPQPPAGGEVVILQPVEQPPSSAAYGISGAQQVGHVGYRAGLWTGTADSWVDLNPAGASESVAYGASNGQQVGYAVCGRERASLWTGTAESWVDLHTPDWDGSIAYGVGDGQQVGYVYYDVYGDNFPYVYRHPFACLWTGTAQSNVVLSYYSPSFAYAVSDGQQVGATGFGSLLDPDFHASLWTGTAESWVDLNPPDAVDSRAYDVSDGQQVGVATFWSKRERRRVDHAGMWSGTAESWVDLHPGGYLGSEARGVSHGHQAGFAWTEGESGNVWHAGMWSGTAGSWVDLSTLLPAGYTYSSAQDIQVTSTDIRVVGYAGNSTLGHTHAVLWRKSLAEPLAGASATAEAGAKSPTEDPCPSDEEPDEDF